MQRRLLILLTGITVVVLAGCGGFSELQERIDDLFDEDRELTAQVWMDGQPIQQISSEDTEIPLAFLPPGERLIHLTVSSYRGAFDVINVLEIDQFDEADLKGSYVGGRIQGSVVFEDDGIESPAARVQVYAIPDGAQLVAGGGPVAIPGEVLPFAAYTNEAGEYDLRALPRDQDYLVIATVAGYTVDMQLVLGLGLRQPVSGVDLTLRGDPDLSAGSVGGVVEAAGADWDETSLPGIRARLDLSPYVPAVGEETVTRVTAAADVTALPEFRFTRLSTLADPDTGAYELPLTPGTHLLSGFAYGFRPEVAAVAVEAGAQTNRNFGLTNDAFTP